MKKKERISSFAHYCWRWLHSRYFIEWLRHIFIAPFGRLRKPVEVKHEKSYNGKYYPVCPHCGNMPYDEDSCYFCGQRFSNRATILEFPEGPIPCTCTFTDGGNAPADKERTENGTMRSTAAKLAKMAFEAGVSSTQITEASWQWFEEWDPGNTMHYAECADAGWRCSHCNVNLAEYLQEALPGESIYLDDPDKRPLLNHCPNCGAPIRKENDHAE